VQVSVPKPASRLRAVGKFWECRLWYYSTAVLDEVLRARVEHEYRTYRENMQNSVEAKAPSSSFFVRRALDAYLAHLERGGRPEKESPRDPKDPRTSATLKCYADMPASLSLRLKTRLRTLPARNGLAWPHGSQRSSVVRQALRWWIRRHP
jgi:hypothetical protein